MTELFQVPCDSPGKGYYYSCMGWLNWKLPMKHDPRPVNVVIIHDYTSCKLEAWLIEWDMKFDLIASIQDLWMWWIMMPSCYYQLQTRGLANWHEIRSNLSVNHCTSDDDLSSENIQLYVDLSLYIQSVCHCRNFQSIMLCTVKGVNARMNEAKTTWTVIQYTIATYKPSRSSAGHCSLGGSGLGRKWSP